MCEDLEKLDEEGRSDKMYQKIKQITGQKTMGSGTVIQDVNGNLLSEWEEVKDGGKNISRPCTIKRENLQQKKWI